MRPSSQSSHQKLRGELAENSHSLNQRALELLGQLKVGAHPEELYLLQLLRWGMDNLPLDLAMGEEEFPNILARHKPAAVMRLLNGDDGYLSEAALDELDPEEAACLLLEALRYYAD